MTSLRDLPPLEPQERPERPTRLRQTLLRHYDRCPRSAALQIKYAGGVPSHALDRGTAFHVFAERATKHLLERDERQLPPEVAKDMMAEIVADPKLVIPSAEVDGLRVMAHHWATGTVLDPEKVVAVERRLHLNVGAWKLSGTIDLATVDGETVFIFDYKSSFLIPSQEEFEHSFQVPFYALLVAFGHPPEDPFPLAPRANQFSLAQVYPRYMHEEGVAERRTWFERSQLLDHRIFMEGVVAKIDHSFETGEWPAVSGTHCSECPAPSECPIPAHLRGTRLERVEAESLAEAWYRESEDASAKWKQLKEYAGRHGSIRLGSDLLLEHTKSEGKRITTTLRKRKLTPEERRAA